MTDFIEISELNFDDEFKTSSNKFGSKSTNFGGGIELLMNDKVKEGSNKMNSDIDLEDLNNLENELNGLVDENTSSSFRPKSDLFGSNDEKPSVRFNDSPSIGQSTAQTDNNEKSWDGYGKFNNIPINPDKNVSSQPQMSKEELLREKFKILRKLEALEKKGVDLSKKYNMESPLAEMQGEYETIMDEKAKQNSVKFQGNMLMAVINGMEFLNNRFDPFDIKLDGWSEQLGENITDYDDIFGELHEKYKSKATMAPELKLLFQLGGSAMMVHMTNTMFKSAMPGMDDILRQNPDLMRSFQNAAVNSMSQQSPGFTGFMSNMMNPTNGTYGEPQAPSGRGPPAPMATQGQNAVPPPQGRAGNNPFPTTTNHSGRNNYMDDGINIRENFGNTQERTQRQPPRNEMKGPSDISDILSGLKTKTINIQDPHQQQDSSTISISDLKELQSDGNMPKKSGRRKPKSASNTISLDI
jgi:hypothetical protein